LCLMVGSFNKGCKYGQSPTGNVPEPQVTIAIAGCTLIHTFAT